MYGISSFAYRILPKLQPHIRQLVVDETVALALIHRISALRKKFIPFTHHTTVSFIVAFLSFEFFWNLIEHFWIITTVSMKTVILQWMQRMRRVQLELVVTHFKRFVNFQFITYFCMPNVAKMAKLRTIVLKRKKDYLQYQHPIPPNFLSRERKL